MSSQPVPESSKLPTKRKKKRKSGGLSNSSDDGDGRNILQSKISVKRQLNLKKSCKQTPWYDINELIETGRALLLSLKLFPSHHQQQNQYTNLASVTPEGLTPDEHTQLRLALRRVAVWRGRSARGRLSHAVDITDGLAGLLLNDAERSMCHNNFTGNNPYQLRNSYSALLLRSVNGLADTYRHQKKSTLLSVSHCCALAGLPLWIVDIRHDASHNDLPSLGLCRIGAIESLRFWKTRYWDTLENKVWGKRSHIGTSDTKTGAVESEVGICTFALDCLVRYQQAALLEAEERESSERNQEARMKNVVKQQLEGEYEPDSAENETKDLLLLPNEPKKDNNDIEAFTDGVQNAGSNNPFAILHDDKPKQKKTKKNLEQKNYPEKGGVATDTSTVHRNNTARAVKNKSKPSSRDCAAEFVREVPIDVAMSTVLTFLIWGVGNDDLMINQGPAFLSGLSELSLTQDVDVTFDKLRAIYDRLIIEMTQSYPGFVAALFVHLIDSILCLDIERGRLNESSSTNSILADNAHCIQQLSCNILYLSMWVRYILSREFHMHFDRSAAIYREEAKSLLLTSQSSGAQRKFQSDPIDLKKKGKKKWTQPQLKFMQSPLPYMTFYSLGVPMNSVSDRLLSHQEKYLCNSGSVVGKLLHLLEGILGENRVVFMGLIERDSEDENVERETELSETGKSSATIDATSTVKNISLEDMEAFLSSSASAEPNKYGGGNQTNDTDHAKKHRLQNEPTNETIIAPDIKPWTLCKSWDSCAIGSMPGYPA